ncbi:hypothetical protein TIFTF001_038727 [Ficus carica]|uniref:J domain-containing protein n=1 Tax=Ficus carica TaxID=3494 RepID=A0AA88JF45_FICCA|nr:hypothetical protein TIFTF001_038727 [Ficus carica]
MQANLLVGPTTSTTTTVSSSTRRRHRWTPLVVAAAASSSSSQNHYAVLGLNLSATSADIKRAYRLLARKIIVDKKEVSLLIFIDVIVGFGNLFLTFPFPNFELVNLFGNLGLLKELALLSSSCLVPRIKNYTIPVGHVLCTLQQRKLEQLLGQGIAVMKFSVRTEGCV